ncbi:MAG: hypothetical protein FD123_4194 [Bacteroidetes bacterium]|nr:MAG: hypothetical protein FD123_4194 [Bacteroidota bacterium]
MQKTILLIFLLCPVFMPAQQLATDLAAQDKTLKGPIKSWVMKANGKVIRIKHFDDRQRLVLDSGGQTILKHVWAYDSIGNLLLSAAYRNGELYQDEWGDHQKFSYTRNSKSQITRKTAWSPYGQKAYEAEYEYDKQGLLTAIKGDAVFLYEEDLYFRTKDHVQTIRNGLVSFKYDAQRRLTEKTIHGQDATDLPNKVPDQLRYRERLQYDASGRISLKTEEHWFGKMGAMDCCPDVFETSDYLCNISTYRYDAAGRLLDEAQYNNHNYSHPIIRYAYEYDAAGNLLAEKRYDTYNISQFTCKINADSIEYYAVKRQKDVVSLCPDYWSQGSPVVTRWEYNVQGQKIHCFYSRSTKPAVVWEYDAGGKPVKETYYDVNHGTLARVSFFDERGNVTKETATDYWSKKVTEYIYEITYY